MILSQDAEFAKGQAEAELKAYEVQLDKVGGNTSMKSGSVINNRLFANHDDSINVVHHLSGVMDQS